MIEQGRQRALPRRGQRHARGRADARRPSGSGSAEHGTFLGWIGDDVLHSLYRIADLCVVPSIYEPFGLVALEAMASGCPCIVADTGGLREVVPVGERVGLRFNGGDAEHLGVMIERLLVDERAARPARDRGLRARADASTGTTSRSGPRASTIGSASRPHGRGRGGDDGMLHGHDAGRLPADAEPHPRVACATCNPGAEVVTLIAPTATVERVSHADLTSAIDRLRARARGGSASAGRPRRDLRLEQPAPLRALHGGPVHRARCCTRSTCACSPSSSTYIVNHAEDRVIFVDDSLVPVLEKLAPSFDGVEHYVVIGDGDAGALPERAALRGAAGRGGPGAVRLPRARRAPGRGALLHERHDRQPQGRALLAPLDQPALDGDADARRHRAVARRPRARGRADVPRQRLGAARTARRWPAPIWSCRTASSAPSRWRALIAAERPTLMGCVPTIFAGPAALRRRAPRASTSARCRTPPAAARRCRGS